MTWKRNVICLLAAALLWSCSGAPAGGGSGALSGGGHELQDLVDRLREDAEAPGAILGVRA